MSVLHYKRNRVLLLVSWLAYNWRLFGVRHGLTAFSFFSGERVLNLYLTAEVLELSWKTIIWEWGSQGRWWPYAWDPFYWSYECIHSAVRYDWSIDSRSSSLKRVRNDRNQELSPPFKRIPSVIKLLVYHQMVKTYQNNINVNANITFKKSMTSTSSSRRCLRVTWLTLWNQNPC